MRTIGTGTLRLEGSITLGGLVEDGGGTFSLGNNNGSGMLVQQMGGLQVDSGLVTTVLNPAVHANRTVVVTGGVTLSGTTNSWTSSIDLSGNDMIVHNGNLVTLTNQIKTGSGYTYNSTSGTWTGTGIRSSACAADTNHYTSLGIIQNTFDGTDPAYSSFDGVSATTILIMMALSIKETMPSSIIHMPTLT